MKNRLIHCTLCLLLLSVAVTSAASKDKRRPGTVPDDVRLIGAPVPAAGVIPPARDLPVRTSSPETATSLDAFHRNTLPLTIEDRYVYMVTKRAGQVFAIGEAGLIARAGDLNLTTWAMANSGIGTDEDVYAIEGSAAGIYLAGTSTGKIYRSTDAGISWTLVYWNPAEIDFINYIKSTDNGNGFIAVGDAAVSGTPMGFLTTTNGGTSWLNLNTNITGATHPNGVRFIGTTGFLNGTSTQAGKTYRGIFRTLNSGSSWSFFTVGNTTADSAVGVAAIDFSSSTGRGLAVKFDSTLWKSTNSGAGWVKIAQLPRMGYSIAFVPGTVYATVVGRNGMIANVDVENNIVQSILMDDQQLFTQVQYASSTEGYLNDDLARRRYYSTISTSGLTMAVPVTSLSELRNTNEAELSWTMVGGATAYDLEFGVIVGSVYRSTVVTTTGIAATRAGLAPGVQYRWRVRARNQLTTGAWSSFKTFFTAGMPRVKEEVVSFPSKPSSSADYRLIYVPSQAGIPVTALFSGNSPTDFRVFRDNGGMPPAHLTELTAGQSLDYSAGAWLIKKDAFIMNTDVDYPSMSQGAVDIPTMFGWNIIGNPYPVPVRWSDVLAWNNLSSAAPYGIAYDYRGDQGYSPAAVLQPFRGYYYYSGGGSLAIPFPFSSTPEVALPEPSSVMRLVYRSASHLDRTLTFGVDPAAADGQDQFDQRKPPMFADQGGLWFERPEWDAKHSRFAGDFRPSFGDGQSWRFTVQHAANEPAVLTLEQREQIPAGFDAVIINDANGMMLSPDEQGSVAVRTNGPYTVIIGTKDYLRSTVAGAVPQSFGLEQNYPNPFNPSTTIRFAVPADAHVTLAVYDLLGREVARPIDRTMMSGTYEQNFHAGRLASGTYVYALRVTSPESGAVLHTSVRKMMLIK